MRPRISLITLGVDDLDRSRSTGLDSACEESGRRQ